MTTLEFLRLLDEVSDQFAWTLTPDAGDHADRRKAARLLLVGTHRSLPDVSMDPVEALCYIRTGHPPSIDALTAAARILEMDRAELQAIASAASDNTWTGADGARTPVESLLELRRELLTSVGLIRHARL